MSVIPACKRCDQPKQQRGRYADWSCPCCDESARCEHVTIFKRWARRFAGRKH